MRQRLNIALLTGFGFAAGFGARMLTESGPDIPPAPVPGAEFVRPAANAQAIAGKGDPSTSKPIDRARILKEIEQVRPQVEAYRRRVDEIASEFDREFVTILNPAQRAIFEERQKQEVENRAKWEAKQAADTTPLSDQQIERLRRQPLWNALDHVAITWRFDRYSHVFKLDEAQKIKTHELLLKRRERFLELVDATPPPSISNSELAVRAQKILQGEKK